MQLSNQSGFLNVCSRLLKAGLFILPVVFAAPDGQILDRASHRFDPYSTVKGIERYASAEEYVTAVNDAQFGLERVVYSSEEIPVVAYVYRRKDARAPLP